MAVMPRYSDVVNKTVGVQGPDPSTVQGFLEDRVFQDPEHYEFVADFREAYSMYAESLGARPVSGAKLGREVARLTGIRSRVVRLANGKNVRVYDGVRIDEKE